MLLGIHVQHAKLLGDFRLGLQTDVLLESLPSTQLPQERDDACPLCPLSVLIGQNYSGKSSLFRLLSFLSMLARKGSKGDLSFPFSVKDLSTQETSHIQLLFYLESLGCLFDYQLHFQILEGEFSIVKEKVLRLDLQDREAFRRALDLNAPANYLREASLEAKLLYEVEGRSPLLDERREETEVLRQELASWLYLPMDDVEGMRKVLSPIWQEVKSLQQKEPERYASSLRRLHHFLPLNSQLRRSMQHEDYESLDLRLFFIYYLLLVDTHRHFILLDAPETGLYPQRVEELLRAMRGFTLHRNRQLLYSTHHSQFLDGMHPSEIWILSTESEEAEEEALYRWMESPEAEDEVKEAVAQAHCAGADPLVQRMYAEGVGMASLWYSGYLERNDAH